MADIVIPIATGARLTALQTLHNLEQGVAITTDLEFCGGDYDNTATRPSCHSHH